MKLFSLKREWILWLIILFPLCLYFMLVHKLPAQVPSHYDIHGRADTYMSPVKLLLNAVPVNLLLYGVLLALPQVDPRRKNYFLFTKAYYYIRVAIHLFLSAVFSFMLLSAAGWHLSIPRLVGLCTMLLFTILGNYLTRVRPNWFIGFRTPWTLENETVWRKTHLLGGRLMFALGLLGAVLILLLPVKAGGKLLLPLVFTGVIIPVVYSLLLYRKIKRENPDHSSPVKK